MKEKECAENLLKELEYHENNYKDFDCIIEKLNDEPLNQCNFNILKEELEKLNLTILNIKEIKNYKRKFKNEIGETVLIFRKEKINEYV